MASSRSQESDREAQKSKEREEKKRKWSEATEEKFVVGMRAVSKENGLFSDPHLVGKYVSNKVGEIRSVKVTRTGTVIIECSNKQQAKEVLKAKRFNGKEIMCFKMRDRPRKRGVISGVSLKVDMEAVLDNTCVYDARRMSRYRDGKKELSESICITFMDEMPERIFIDYVCYRVRPFEAAPLRCFCCQQYGHVAAVCRGDKKCGRCGKGQEECDDKCEENEIPVKCPNCNENHHAGSAKCPQRIKEAKLNKIKKEKNMTYAEAVKSLEGKDKEVEKEPEAKRKGVEQQCICFDKGRFLAFIAMVINCAVEIPRKSERIRMVMDAARRFLDIVEISGEDLNDILTEEFAPAPTAMSVSEY